MWLVVVLESGTTQMKYVWDVVTFSIIIVVNNIERFSCINTVQFLTF